MDQPILQLSARRGHRFRLPGTPVQRRLPRPIRPGPRPRAARQPEPPPRLALIAADNDVMVGLLNFAPTSDLDLDPNVAVEVTTMYVLPEHWRVGVGRALMGTAIHDFRVAGYQHATLWVMAANLRARAFYEAN